MPSLSGDIAYVISVSLMAGAAMDLLDLDHYHYYHYVSFGCFLWDRL
jgi:uncharacterized membrane protein YhhN